MFLFKREHYISLTIIKIDKFCIDKYLYQNVSYTVIKCPSKSLNHPNAFENSLSYECQTLTNCSHHYDLQNPKYCYLQISSDVKEYLMGGCPMGEFYKGVKWAQANLLPMGLPHLVSQYNLSPSPESQPSRRPQAKAGVQPVNWQRSHRENVDITGHIPERVRQGNTRILRSAEYI